MTGSEALAGECFRASSAFFNNSLAETVITNDWFRMNAAITVTTNKAIPARNVAGENE